MTKTRLLLQWIGHSDLRAMAGSLPEGQREAVLAEIRGPLPESGDLGPTRTLVETQAFDEIYLLSNYRTEWNNLYLGWLGGKAGLVRVDLKKPTDYVSIFRIADGELAKIRKRVDWPEIELCLHLSPGTPAMAAVWLLLGKTRYPATFYETFAGRSWVTEIPFDLTIDVIPEILRNPDLALRHLAAESPREIAGFEQIAGDCQALRVAVGRAKRAAMRGVPVLLLGESGTGKEMFARAIHDAGPRRRGPFVPVNCAAVSRDLLESEWLGQKTGARMKATIASSHAVNAENTPQRGGAASARRSRNDSCGPWVSDCVGCGYNYQYCRFVPFHRLTASLRLSRVH